MFMAEDINDRTGAFKVGGQRVKDACSFDLIFAIIRGIDVWAVRCIAETIVEIPCDRWVDGKAIVATQQGSELCSVSRVMYEVGKNLNGVGDLINDAATNLGRALCRRGLRRSAVARCPGQRV